MHLKRNLKLRKMGSRYMIVCPTTGNGSAANVFTLNATAAMLWKEAEGKDFDAEMLCNALCEKYEVDHEMALNDAIATINIWKENGLLEA